MFLAKLRLLPLMTTTKHAEPHTHTHTHTPHEGCSQKECSSSLPPLLSQQLTEVRRPLASISILHGETPPIHPKPLEPCKNQLLEVCCCWRGFVVLFFFLAVISSPDISSMLAETVGISQLFLFYCRFYFWSFIATLRRRTHKLSICL